MRERRLFLPTCDAGETCASPLLRGRATSRGIWVRYAGNKGVPVAVMQDCPDHGFAFRRKRRKVNMAGFIPLKIARLGEGVQLFLMDACAGSDLRSETPIACRATHHSA